MGELSKCGCLLGNAQVLRRRSGGDGYLAKIISILVNSTSDPLQNEHALRLPCGFLASVSQAGHVFAVDDINSLSVLHIEPSPRRHRTHLPWTSQLLTQNGSTGGLNKSSEDTTGRRMEKMDTRHMCFLCSRTPRGRCTWATSESTQSPT
jgi:hypothetical protein